MSMPRDFPAYSIGRVGLTESLPDGTHRPVQENSLEFAGLAFAANQGLIILNKPNGFRTLRTGGIIFQPQYGSFNGRCSCTGRR
ncbi:hypothetical protein HYQ45_006688 [Verticillium longisporum]|uniref:Uncharacterized protein n=1 Tax=Verticillium longisporum TaxID=100787 RepID=A0A8I3AR02_VERLO|nr:hypothetical protein HYQ45_006688 [Verticillium longisporum]